MLVGFYLDQAQRSKVFKDVDLTDSLEESVTITTGKTAQQVLIKRMEAIERLRLNSLKFKQYTLTSPVKMVRGEREV